jgi:hypothetical protein
MKPVGGRFLFEGPQSNRMESSASRAFPTLSAIKRRASAGVPADTQYESASSSSQRHTWKNIIATIYATQCAT